MESRELWKGFLYSVIDVNIPFFLHICMLVPVYIFLMIYCISLRFGPITAERPILSHVAAGSAADAEGGGGQRKVQEENSDTQPCSSLASLCAFSGGDPPVSSRSLHFIGGLQHFQRRAKKFELVHVNNIN